MKRMIAMLLCLSMVLGLLPTVATAQEAQSVQTVVTAEELPGVSRVDDLQLPQKQSHRLYEDDEIVTVIVELEENPLLTGFQAKSGSSVGSQVSAYLTAAATEAAALKNRQDSLVQVMGKAVGMELNVTGRYVNAVNAVTVRVPYGKLEALRAVEGVRSVNVERVFSRPVTTAGALIEGDFGHSYNMTDLGEVWAAGYTGQGMLVAVLDTGLDLTYTSWGNF
jgi:subtilisin family serine protease